MKKPLVAYLLFIFYILSITSHSNDYYEKIRDHEWYTVSFYYKNTSTTPESKVVDYVLIRLTGSGRWEMKKYWRKPLEYFAHSKYFILDDYYIEDRSILFDDFRVSFLCYNFPEQLKNSPIVLEIKKAYK